MGTAWLKKQTFKWVAKEDGSTTTPTLTSVDQAKGIIFTDAGKAHWADASNYLQIEWALPDNKTLKCTVKYGTEDGITAKKEPVSGIATLESASNYYKTDYLYSCTELTDNADHLF